MGSSLAAAEQRCSQQVMAVKMRVQTTLEVKLAAG